MPYLVQAAPRISLAQFSRILTQFKSPVAPNAAQCYQIIVDNGLDPAVALAFFAKESTFGTRGASVETRNWGNVRTPFKAERETGRHPRNFVIFRSWEDGLLDWCERIVHRYIGQRKLTTPETILPVYAPSSDGNNVQRYVDQVNTWIAKWIKEDPQPIASSAPANTDDDPLMWAFGSDLTPL